MISSSEMEAIVTKAVKLAFDNHSSVKLSEGFVSSEPNLGSLDKALGAKLILKCLDSCYELLLFIPVTFAIKVVSDTLIELFDEDDPEVYESVGEFLNIISGIICKDINTQSRHKFELQCPTLFPRLTKIDVSLLNCARAFHFNSDLGPFLFAYKHCEIQESAYESRN